VSTLPITAVILTKNEKDLIGRAVRTVDFCAERLVLDCGSEDGTQEIARAAGARVEHQTWLGWSAQRNRAAELATNDWILVLEADEVITPRLRRSIHEAMAAEPDPHDGFNMNRRGDFLGALLPNESRPAKQKSFVRLYNRRHSSWDLDMVVHEEVLVPGVRRPLRGVLLHWRGHQLDDYVPSFDRYAAQEARELTDKGVRVSALHVAARPVLRFGWLYLVRGDWRLGARGLIHAMLKGVQEFLRYARAWEMQHSPEAVIDPPASLTDGAVSVRRPRRLVGRGR
jgi:(heptosyl)LPS beta-1,4-glucosyltransferase